ncbi:FscB [Rhodobacteraceae bacterium WD3A24]|nr:FscB [Rhodobacteraceae bacterium WD3A24]
MSHVLHLCHQPADLGAVTSNHLSTDAGTFDPDLDVNSLRFEGNEDSRQPFYLDFDTPIGDLWFQFRTLTADDAEFGIDSNDTPFVSFYDANGALVARLRGHSDETIEAVAEGDSQVVGTTTFTIGQGNTYWMDIKVAVGADITIEFYVGGVLVSSATAANTGGKGKPVHIKFDNPSQTWHSGTASWHIAHLAVLDGVSTIGRRFARRTPDTVGNYDQWAGSLASLGDGSVLTRMTSDTAGQRQNATLAGPTIAGVHLKAIAQAGTSGPGNLAGSLRLNASDYDAASVALGSAMPETAFFSWAQNPDTSAAWTDADLPDEIGLLSAS